MGALGAVAGVGTGLALVAGAAAALKATIFRRQSTTAVQAEAHEYAAKLRLATEQASHAVSFTNESADVVHNRVAWMWENWAAIYNRLGQLPSEDSVRANFGALTERAVNVMIHVAGKHGREIRYPAPLLPLSPAAGLGPAGK